jgi:hypothetical protein
MRNGRFGRDRGCHLYRGLCRSITRRAESLMSGPKGGVPRGTRGHPGDRCWVRAAATPGLLRQGDIAHVGRSGWPGLNPGTTWMDHVHCSSQVQSDLIVMVGLRGSTDLPCAGFDSKGDCGVVPAPIVPRGTIPHH